MSTGSIWQLCPDRRKWDRDAGKWDRDAGNFCNLKLKAVYSFFLVAWNDYTTAITEEFETQADPFGQELGLKGAVVRAFRSARGDTFKQIEVKEWPGCVRERMGREQDPFMLGIRENFADFSPLSSTWAIVWFSDFREKPDCIYRVFGALAQMVRRQEDVLQYPQSLSVPGKRADAIEIKPGAFGVSINVKALLQDLKRCPGVDIADTSPTRMVISGRWHIILSFGSDRRMRMHYSAMERTQVPGLHPASERIH